MEGSKAREHLYEVAGDLIQGMPQMMDSALRSTDRTQYALAKMGEDFFRGRVPLEDREYVDAAIRGEGAKRREVESRLLHRCASRYLRARDSGAGSAEWYFFDNPEFQEVRQLGDSGALSNDPKVSVGAVAESDNPDRTKAEARKETKGAPPTVDKIVKGPGGKQFSTLNRLVIDTDAKAPKKLQTGWDDAPKMGKVGRRVR